MYFGVFLEKGFRETSKYYLCDLNVEEFDNEINKENISNVLIKNFSVQIPDQEFFQLLAENFFEQLIEVDNLFAADKEQQHAHQY